MLFDLDGCEPHEEDEWEGRPVRIGEAVVRPTLAVERCAVTTRDPETGRRDLDTLHLIRGYREPRGEVEIPFGMLAEVERARPGAGRRPGRAAELFGVSTGAYVVDAVRSPDRAAERLALGDARRRAAGAGPERRSSSGQASSRPRSRTCSSGCVTQIGEQGWNIGRMAPLVAGWPETVCGTTVDRQCGSSMQANFNAAAAIWSGQLDLVVSAGVEMMSRVPMGSNGGDLSRRLLERWQIVPQGISAEVIAEEWGLSREQLDAYSLESHRRAIARDRRGPVRARDRPGRARRTPHGAARCDRDAVDETPRRDTSAETLAALAPAFLPDGSVTAGNSSQICDGAAAVLLASEAACARLGLEPRGAVRLVRPRRRRPAPDAPRQPAGVREGAGEGGPDWDDVAVVEVNEAFASVVLQFAARRGPRGPLGRTSTRTAAASRSATRSAPPARA